MKRSQLLQLATFYPLVYIFCLLPLLTVALAIMALAKVPQTVFLIEFGVSMVLYLLFFPIIIYLFIFYIRHVLKNKKIPSQRKGYWIFSFFFGSVVVFPWYWYKFLR